MEEPMASLGGDEPEIVDAEVADAPSQAAEEDELTALLGEEGEDEGADDVDELPQAENGVDEATDEPPQSRAPEPGEVAPEQEDNPAGEGAGSPHGEPQSDWPGIKLFLGGLSWDTTEETLRQHFGRYGQVLKAEVMKDRLSGNPRGFGFVTFADETAAEEVTQMKHVLDGRQIDAKRSVPQGNLGNKPKSRKIFVGGLAPETTDDQFRDYFSQFGEVADAQIMQDHTSGRSRGFGFVTFQTESSVEKVFQSGYMHTLAGKKVEVKTATPRGQHGQNQRDGTRGGGRNNSHGGGGGPRGKSEHYGQRSGRGGGGYGGDHNMMGSMAGQHGGMMPAGMMGAYGMVPPAYAMGGFGGMGFAGPYGAYSGMMMQQMGAYGYGGQGYGGNFAYGPMGFAGGMQQEQVDGPSPAAAPITPDSNGAGDQSGQGGRYHPYARLSPSAGGTA